MGRTTIGGYGIKNARALNRRHTRYCPKDERMKLDKDNLKTVIENQDLLLKYIPRQNKKWKVKKL